MTLRLHNTMTRSAEPFTPIAPPHVSVYTCGPTVYNYAHIGNFRSFLNADVLRRALERNELEAALTRIQELATRDALTGLPNRGHARDRLERAIARQSGDTCCAVLCHCADSSCCCASSRSHNAINSSTFATIRF